MLKLYKINTLQLLSIGTKFTRSSRRYKKLRRLKHHMKRTTALSKTTKNTTLPCIPPRSLKRCEKCIESGQCMEGSRCSPYLRKCISKVEYHPCPAPNAGCKPPCHDHMDQDKCTCRNKNFPGHWARAMCQGK